VPDARRVVCLPLGVSRRASACRVLCCDGAEEAGEAQIRFAHRERACVVPESFQQRRFPSSMRSRHCTEERARRQQAMRRTRRRAASVHPFCRSRRLRRHYRLRTIRTIKPLTLEGRSAAHDRYRLRRSHHRRSRRGARSLTARRTERRTCVDVRTRAPTDVAARLLRSSRILCGRSAMWECSARRAWLNLRRPGR